MISFEVLMDYRENPKKCTVQPLNGRPGLHIRFCGRSPQTPPLRAQVLLHVDGAPLQELTKSQKIESVALIDCVWKRVKPLMRRLEGPLPTLVRIPDGFVTAYLRRNKNGKDPEEGLATIEAMFIAAAFCGDWDESLLEKYYFNREFLAKNEAQWKLYGLGPYAK